MGGDDAHLPRTASVTVGQAHTFVGPGVPAVNGTGITYTPLVSLTAGLEVTDRRERQLTRQGRANFVDKRHHVMTNQ